MRLRSGLVGTVAVLASVLDVATGVLLVLTVNRSSAISVLAILTCVFYCLLCALNIITLVLARRRHTFLTRLFFTAVAVAPTVLAGITLAMAILNNNLTSNAVLCSVTGSCTWTHEKAVLSGFVLWFGAGVAQASYMTTYVTTVGMPSSRGPLRGDTPVSTPTRSVMNMSMVERPPFRYPMIRKDTDEEPFPYEDALRAKSDMPPPGHRSSSSTTKSARTDSKFVQSHFGDGSHNRSWASTLPTLINTVSPRLYRGRTTPSISCDRSPARTISREKSDSISFGVAYGSPTHRNKNENQSISYTHSSTSSTSVRKGKKLLDCRFHLPSSPVSRLDIGDFPKLLPRASTCPIASSPRSSILQRTENDDGDVFIAGTPELHSTTTATSYDSPKRRTPVQKALRRPISQRLSFSEIPGLLVPASPVSPGHRKSGIFDSLRPRLPIAKSPTRASWLVGPNTSPTRQRHSPEKLSVPDDHDAFAEWDTSNVERDPSYLVSMKDSRDISGASRTVASPRRLSTESQLSFWEDRSARDHSETPSCSRLPTVETVRDGESP